MDPRALLEPVGLWSAEVERWVLAEQVETVADLFYAFRSKDELMQVAPFMADSWLLCAKNIPGKFERPSEVRSLLRDMRVSATAVRRRWATKPVKRVRAIRPRKAKQTTSFASDEAARLEAATAAVELSLRWGPAAGFAKGLAPTDPMVERVKAIRGEEGQTVRSKNCLGSAQDMD